MASVVEGASQLTQGSWGRAGGALALGVICHLALEGTEISVSVQPVPGSSQPGGPVCAKPADQCASLAAQPPPRCYPTLTLTPGSSTLPAGTPGHGLMGVGGFGAHRWSQTPPPAPAPCTARQTCLAHGWGSKDQAFDSRVQQPPCAVLLCPR